MAQSRTGKARVVVIGGGGTGAAILCDLALRGYAATLIERGEVASGTTGRHHGQLHCGARYAVADPSLARECMDESRVLRRIASQSVEFNGGLFVSLDEEDDTYVEQFLDSCSTAGIPTERMSARDALGMEPGLNPELRSAIMVPDGTLDAWRLPMQFLATARAAGAEVRTFSRVTDIGTKAGRISELTVHDLASGRDHTFKADVVVNAAGAWAGQVAALAGVSIDVLPSPGTMLAVRRRLVNMVVSRLHFPDDGDIVVPQRGQSIIGSTQRTADSPDDSRVLKDEIEFLRACGVVLVPGFREAPFHAAWAAPRPLVAPRFQRTGDADPSAGTAVRSLSRDFLCHRHPDGTGRPTFFSIIGGKATLLRLMAEKLVDMVCESMGDDTGCTTRDRQLLDYRSFFTAGRQHA